MDKGGLRTFVWRDVLWGDGPGMMVAAPRDADARTPLKHGAGRFTEELNDGTNSGCSGGDIG